MGSISSAQRLSSSLPGKRISACTSDVWRQVDLRQSKKGRRYRLPFFTFSVDFNLPDGRIKTPAMRSPEYVQMSTLAAITLSLIPCRTSGCPGKDDAEISACNRPHGGSNPSDILSYPFKLAPKDIEIVQLQMKGEMVKSFRE
ncbi:MAG: hypothetical protein ACYC2E_00265 [Sulfuricella sp.]